MKKIASDTGWYARTRNGSSNYNRSRKPIGSSTNLQNTSGEKSPNKKRLRVESPAAPLPSQPCTDALADYVFTPPSLANVFFDQQLLDALDVLEDTGRDSKAAASGKPDVSQNSNQVSDFNKISEHDLQKDSTSEANIPTEALLLSQWNLPAKVLERYDTLGIKCMFPWQAECLMLPGVLERRSNLVYSAPTSAGKTLVAELLAVKCIFETKKKVLFILPFVSMTHEKEVYLKQLLGPAGVKVGGFHGGRSPPGGLAAVDLALCTIEKANSIINHLMEEGKLDTVAGLVVDELHMIGDPHRGYLLELLLTKVLYAKSCATSELETVKENVGRDIQKLDCEGKGTLSVQIIGMSATLPNLSSVALWLKAQLYCTDYRPVPLIEMLKVGPALYQAVPDNSGALAMSKLKEYDQPCERGHDEEVSMLCWESIKEGHSVLIFCPTKNRCESLALLTVKQLKQLVAERSDTDKPVTSPSELIGVCEQLRRTSVGLDSVLEQTVPYGVGFHHAGLTFDEREIVEGSFRLGKLKVLVATSTLSSGVNLPARRVIIRTPIFHGSVLDVQVYKQMVGRAGRKGVDTLGESVLICKPTEKQKAVKLILGSLKPIKSCLGSVAVQTRSGKKVDSRQLPSALKRAVLEVVASGAAVHSSDLHRYVSSTLLFAELTTSLSEFSSKTLCSLADETLLFLMENDFVGQHEATDERKEMLYGTQFGQATVASSLSPEDALVVFAEMQAAQRGFVLENELHIIYQVTPISIQEQWPTIDWYIYLRMWESFSPDVKRVADMIGICESFLVRAASGRVPTYTTAQKRALMVHRRFFAALALQDLVKEVPMALVARRYGVSKGLIQTLQTSAGMFAGMVTVFCQRLGWNNLELLLSQFQGRLTFGVERELTDLVRVSLLNGQRARALYNAGYHTLVSLATANPFAVEAILRNSVPFKSYKLDRRDAGGAGTLSVNWCPTLKRGLSETEAALLIVGEAKQLLSEDFSVPLSVWNTGEAGWKPEVANRELPALEGPSPLILPKARKQVSHLGLLQASETMTSHRVMPNEKETASAHLLYKTPAVAHKQFEHTNSLTKPATNSPLFDFPSTSDSEHIPRLPFVSPHHFEQDFLHKSSTPLTSKNAKTSLLVSVNSSRLKDRCSQSPHFVSPAALPSKQHTTEITPSNGRVLRRGTCSTSADRLHPEEREKTQSGLIADLSSMDFSLNLSPISLTIMDAACKEAGEGRDDKIPDNSRNASLRSAGSISVVEESPVQGSSIQHSTNVTPRSFSWSDICRDIKLSSFDVSGDLNAIPSTPPNAEPPRVPPADSARCVTPGQGMAESSEVLVVPNSPIDRSTCSFQDLSVIHATQDDDLGLTIIDVAADLQLFRTFVSECLDQDCVAVSVAKQPLLGGGGVELGRPSLPARGLPIPTWNEEIIGLAVCWGGRDVYYVPLVATPNADDSDELCAELTLDQRVSSVQTILTRREPHPQKLVFLDAKRQLKELSASCQFFPSGCLCDPFVADWLLDPDSDVKTLSKMVLRYLPDSPHLLQARPGGYDAPLTTLAMHGPTGKLRAAAECVLAYRLMEQLGNLLEAEKLTLPFLNIEMPIQAVLARMELVGVGFSEENCRDVETLLKARLLEIEKQCFNLARRPFSLSSPDDVAQVLFIELRLPSGSEPDGSTGLLPSSRGGRKRGKMPGRGKRLQHLSTSKGVLEKIIRHHPLPGLILEWRRISNTLTKVVYPLEKESLWHSELSSPRVHYSCHIHTSTGRINVADPNLQNVPKAYVICDNTSTSAANATRAGLVMDDEVNVVCESQDCNTAGKHNVPKAGKPVTICMRSVFVAEKGNVLLGADYSQLELRILAHLSGDHYLRSILNSDGDVFKMIASKWLSVDTLAVTADQRSQAKSICYGMVYGIGPKALGEQLKVGPEEAAEFMEIFKSQFPGLQLFIRSTIEQCSARGYIATLSGRKRHLPGIRSTCAHTRSQAERQAVNSTVQGSAADIVKQAMISIDECLKSGSWSSARSNPQLLDQCDKSLLLHHAGTSVGNRSTSINLSADRMVLQIHDELLFEVRKESLSFVALLVKEKMESAVDLTVRLPVKLQTGSSWGTLAEFMM